MLRLPFRADHVGSLLRLPALHTARWQHSDGVLSAESLRQIEDNCIREAVRMQEAVGLKAVTDGEYRRAFWHYDFLAGLDGVEMVEVESPVQFSGAAQLKAVAPAVTGRLGYTEHDMVSHFDFLKQTAQVTPKQSIPSPTALHYRGGGARRSRPRCILISKTFFTIWAWPIKKPLPILPRRVVRTYSSMKSFWPICAIPTNTRSFGLGVRRRSSSCRSTPT